MSAGSDSVAGVHTPGPWSAVPETDASNFLHSIYSEGYKALLIARCDQNGEHTADAHLIAAAPDLLAALIAMEAEKSDYMMLNNLGDPAEQHTNKIARAAIAKTRSTT